MENGAGFPAWCREFHLDARNSSKCGRNGAFDYPQGGGWRCGGAGAVVEGVKRALGEDLPEMRPNCAKMSLENGFKGSWSADHDPMGG